MLFSTCEKAVVEETFIHLTLKKKNVLKLTSSKGRKLNYRSTVSSSAVNSNQYELHYLTYSHREYSHFLFQFTLRKQIISEEPYLFYF